MHGDGCDQLISGHSDGRPAISGLVASGGPSAEFEPGGSETRANNLLASGVTEEEARGSERVLQRDL